VSFAATSLTRSSMRTIRRRIMIVEALSADVRCTSGRQTLHGTAAHLSTNRPSVIRRSECRRFTPFAPTARLPGLPPGTRQVLGSSQAKWTRRSCIDAVERPRRHWTASPCACAARASTGFGLRAVPSGL
jgi:hypothetical protein